MRRLEFTAQIQRAMQDMTSFKLCVLVQEQKIL